MLDTVHSHSTVNLENKLGRHSVAGNSDRCYRGWDRYGPDHCGSTPAAGCREDWQDCRICAEGSPGTTQHPSPVTLDQSINRNMVTIVNTCSSLWAFLLEEDFLDPCP